MATFTHLHVASGYSLRHGASTPVALVEQAAGLGMDALALTDRDGLYGAVKFVQACEKTGIQPILGVDLAVEPTGLLQTKAKYSRSGPPVRKVPVRGGAAVDPRHPRVTVLALAGDQRAGLDETVGWGQLCRLVSATHARGERGRPVATTELVTRYASAKFAAENHPRVIYPVAAAVTGTLLSDLEDVPALVVLLGPASEFGQAVLAERPDLARDVLDRWRSMLPSGALAVEIVNHRGPRGSVASRAHAVRMLGLAHACGIPAVLTNMVRHLDRDGAVTVDVLDAARRLVPLDGRHLDRTTAEGYLAGPAEMEARAEEIADAAGELSLARMMLKETEVLADRCRLRPQVEMGLGGTQLPELEKFGLATKLEAHQALRYRCEQGIGERYPNLAGAKADDVRHRLDDELRVIQDLEIPEYFLAVREVCDLIRRMGGRVAARGSGAGSLVNHLIGISGIDPLKHNLLMERFLTSRRAYLPDIDLDVESDRREDIYREILKKFGDERVSCVSMMDTYRVRHAVRDAGAALGLPPGETDTIAKAFPHIRARDVRYAIQELPELRSAGLDSARLDLLFELVERLDGLPRHIALHPCGVIISNAGLLNRTPVEASWKDFPMSQFDKDDVEAMGLLKLDVLGIRMQSAMAYAIKEIKRVDGPQTMAAGEHPPDAGYFDDEGRIVLDAVPLDDEPTFQMIRTSSTLGCFQIESPGQRELIGKFGPENFHDLIVDISLYRPGPVQSDMITPFLRARQGWDEVHYIHSALKDALADTCGVVVFHEQVLLIIQALTGCELAEADEVRRAMGSPVGQAEVQKWLRIYTRDAFTEPDRARIWSLLVAFASFGFCKAHAAAFALPTYQSAWLKAHHPAAFLAGVLTHDPGMYPKRLILDDARNLGIAILPLDVNRSVDTYRVERIDPDDHPEIKRYTDLPMDAVPDALPDVVLGVVPKAVPDVVPENLPENDEDDEERRHRIDGRLATLNGVRRAARGYGIRLSLTDVKGINAAEVSSVVANQPYHSLGDFWQRAEVSRPVAERLVLTGAFDSVHGIGPALPAASHLRLTRRDLLLQLSDLDRWTPRRSRDGQLAFDFTGDDADAVPDGTGAIAGRIVRGDDDPSGDCSGPGDRAGDGTRLHRAGDGTRRSGLPELTDAERLRVELDVLGLDASRHVMDFYAPMLESLGVTRAPDLRGRRSRADLLVAGVKVATQTPPIRGGRRVVFLTIDDSEGPIDATFFEDVQGAYAGTVFHSWLLLVRGVLRKAGRRGVSLRATGAWELPMLWEIWSQNGPGAVLEMIRNEPDGSSGKDPWRAAGQASRTPSGLPATDFGTGIAVPGVAPVNWEVAAGLPAGDRADGRGAPAASVPAPGPGRPRAGGMGGGEEHRRVLVHASGFRQSPYADLAPPGDDVRDTRRSTPPARKPGESRAGADRPDRSAPRKLWHSSPGSSGG